MAPKVTLQTIRVKGSVPYGSGQSFEFEVQANLASADIATRVAIMCPSPGSPASEKGDALPLETLESIARTSRMIRDNLAEALRGTTEVRRPAYATEHVREVKEPVDGQITATSGGGVTVNAR